MEHIVISIFKLKDINKNSFSPSISVNASHIQRCAFPFGRPATLNLAKITLFSVENISPSAFTSHCTLKFHALGEIFSTVTANCCSNKECSKGTTSCGTVVAGKLLLQPRAICFCSGFNQLLRDGATCSLLFTQLRFASRLCNISQCCTGGVLCNAAAFALICFC